MPRKKKPLSLLDEFGKELEIGSREYNSLLEDMGLIEWASLTGRAEDAKQAFIDSLRAASKERREQAISEAAESLSDEDAQKIHQIVEDRKPTFVLSDEQEEAKRQILAWLEGPEDEYRLGGFAGTGKTSILKYILSEIQEHTSTAISAFTGKATMVLRRKGIFNAQTLHSLLYQPEYDSIKKKMIWTKRTVLPVDLVIVDEASMVSKELYDDLTAHDVKLLFVGDPAQLEPVGDNPNLMRETNFTMTQIHRQAQNSPILRLAKAVREGRQDIPLGEWGDEERGHVKVVDSMRGIKLEDYDIILCARNATRHQINEKRRIQLGRIGDPVQGESVMCLRNNKEKGVFNGMILNVDSIDGIWTVGGKMSVVANLSDDAGDKYYEVPMRLETFGRDNKDFDRSPSIPFDFAYCCTIHKTQGSEFNKVLWLNEPLWKVDFNRLAYTAITRAAKSLTIVNMT